MRSRGMEVISDEEMKESLKQDLVVWHKLEAEKIDLKIKQNKLDKERLVV